MTGYSNIGIGRESLFENLGNSNLGIGFQTLFSNIDGDNNVVVGNNALKMNISGNGNIAIGNSSGLNETGSNKLYIENSGADADNALIYGEFDTNLLRVNGNLEISGETNLHRNVATGVALRVNGSEALWYDGTYFSWGFGGTANFFADNVGLGTATPNSKLEIVGGSDVEVTNGLGFIVLGDVGGTNIGIDNNEIMARNNGAIATLFLNANGGDVSVGGTVVHTSDRRFKKRYYKSYLWTGGGLTIKPQDLLLEKQRSEK